MLGRGKIYLITLVVVISFLLVPVEGLQSSYPTIKRAYGMLVYPTFREDFDDSSLLGWWWYKKERPDSISIANSQITLSIPASSAPFQNSLVTSRRYRLGTLEWYGRVDMSQQSGGWASTAYAVFLYEDDTAEEVDFEFVPSNQGKVFQTIHIGGTQYSHTISVNNLSQRHLYKVVVTPTSTSFYIDGNLTSTVPGLSFAGNGAYIMLGAYSKQNETRSGFMSVEWLKYTESSG